MRHRVTPPADLAALVPSWEAHLRAERESPQTVKAYGDGVRRYLTWCTSTGTAPVLDRPTVTGFVVALLDAGAERATARSRQLALRRFAAWLVEEGELPADPLAGLHPPRLDQKVVPALTDPQLKALLAACAGPDLCPHRDDLRVARVRLGVRLPGCGLPEVLATTSGCRTLETADQHQHWSSRRSGHARSVIGSEAPSANGTRPGAS